MAWGGNKITDHNRSALNIAVNRIEESTRMANGTMRKYIIADKRTFSVSWDNVPQSAARTVDGFWGKNEIENWYNTVPGSFVLSLYYGDGTHEDINVMMTKYAANVSKRGVFDFWHVELELEEV